VACTPAPPPSASTSVSAPAPSAIAASGLATYAFDRFAFEYPADWNPIGRNLAREHYDWIYVVLATGGEPMSCPSALLEGDCVVSAPSPLPAAGVVVDLSVWMFGPRPQPSPDSRLPNGWPVSETETPTESTWRITTPRWESPLVVDAHFRGPETETFRAEVRSLVMSLEVPSDLAVHLPTGATASCNRVSLDATLHGDPLDSMVAWLVTANGTRVNVTWPPDYSARFSPGLEVLDATGALVLRAAADITSACRTASSDLMHLQPPFL
jgi:hypothetical protein